MNMVTIALKSLKQRRLASGLTALNIALGVMLMVLVLVMFGAVNSAFTQRSIAYDLIVGPKGAELQLVLSAVYRVQPPIENLPYLYLNQLKQDRRVVSAVPLAFGDVTQEGSFPIIGTTPEFFENEYTPGQSFKIRGTRINGLLDTIIGHEVARKNGWDIGSTFSIIHGGAESGHLHDERFVVVAVLAPTGTANDRTVFLNLEGFYAIAGHSKPVKEVEKRLRDFYAADPERLAVALEQIEAYKKLEAEESGAGDDHAHHHHETPDAMKEVTAILIRTRQDTPFDSFQLLSELKTGYQAMAVNPVIPINNLIDRILGNAQKGFVALIAVIILGSGVGLFVSIYNSMSDRRREIGIMRALGAGRMHVFGIILAESTLLCVGGGLAGWIAGHGLAVISAPWLIERTGLLINPWAVDPWEATLFPVLVGLAALVGFLPAMTAYRTNVADALSS